MHDQFAIESFMKRSCSQLFDATDFVIENCVKSGEIIHARAVMGDYEAYLEAIAPEYDEIEMVSAFSRDDKEWEYSNPSEEEVKTAMKFLQDDIGSFEEPDLVRIVLYRTKTEDGVIVKQMAVVIDLAGTRTMNKIEYHAEGTEKPEFAAAKIL